MKADATTRLASARAAGRARALLCGLLAVSAACYRGMGAGAGADDGGADDGDGSGSASDGGSDAGDSGGDGPAACADTPVDMRRLTELQYRRSIDAIFDGKVQPSAMFPSPSGKTPTGYSTELGAEEFGEHDVEQVVYAAEDVAEGVAAVAPELIACAGEAGADAACVGEFLDRYGRRIYRRALTDDERATLLAVHAAAVADDASFTDALALVVDEMLQTPQFLYISEYAAASPRPLEGFEVASRLSFLLWDSIPDDTLLDLAETDALVDRDAVISQAERMLADAKADTTIARFFREWSQTRMVSPADKSTEMFPFFDTDFAASVNESFDRYTIATVRDGGTIDDMLRGSTAWVDAAMAEFFGVQAPSGDDWAEVELDATRYRGVLTHPALQASLAHSDRTSPVFRGAFVRKRLLCEAMPPPPAGAMSVHLDLPPDPTARQESEARIARADCGACHALIDPAGLAFETFDAAGRYTTNDALGRAIDPAGTLPGVAGMDITFADHAEMIDRLAEVPDVQKCFARHLFRFAMSRMDTDADACTIAEIEQTLVDAEGDLGAALVAIVGTDAYLQREAP